MNILDVAIRAVLVPFRSLSRCLAENYKMYFGYSTVFPYSTSQAELKWIWAAHRCSIRISFRGVFWKFPQAPVNFYWDDPHNRPHNPPHPGTSQSLRLIFIWQNCSKLTIYMQNYKLKTDSYTRKTERIQRWNKKDYQNLFVSLYLFTEGPVLLTGL